MALAGSLAIGGAAAAGQMPPAPPTGPTASPSPTAPEPPPAPVQPPRVVPAPPPPLPAALAPQPTTILPEPSGRPMQLDLAGDAVLRLRREQSSFETFREIIAAAVERHPGTIEAAATEDIVLAQLAEARSALRPTVDATVTYYRVISREFSNDPTNIIERSRPESRTDALLTAQQTVFDFGASAKRAAAAGARLRAAGADLEATADQLALNAIAAWFNVYGYRALVGMTEAFVASQRELRAAVETRIREGVSAEGDVAQVDSNIAQAETVLARFRRQLAGAEARFSELTGMPPPPLERVIPPAPLVANREEAALASEDSAPVRSARALADATRRESRAARADQLPAVVAGVDAGRYGVFENERDYDIRGRVAMRWRLMGNTDARADQAEARARTADAQAERIAQEAARDAAIAWSDVQALQQQLDAVEAAYIAARRSRDVIAERFRAARGTLFDVAEAEDTYFQSAIAYIQSLTELDSARYILLSKTGRLLEVLEIDTDRLRGEGER